MRWGGIVASLVVAAVVGVGLYEYREPLLKLVGVEADAKAEPKDKKPEKKKQDPNMVEVSADQQNQLGLQMADAETREIVARVDVPGTVMFDERRITHLRPRTKGRVLSLTVQPGDAVAAGQTVATLDASGLLDASNGLDAAKASLAEKDSAAAEAEVALKRAGQLIKIGGISQAELERRQTEATKAKAAVATAQARHRPDLVAMGGPFGCNRHRHGGQRCQGCACQSAWLCSHHRLYARGLRCAGGRTHCGK